MGPQTWSLEDHFTSGFRVDPTGYSDELIPSKASARGPWDPCEIALCGRWDDLWKATCAIVNTERKIVHVKGWSSIHRDLFTFCKDYHSGIHIYIYIHKYLLIDNMYTLYP